MKSDKPPRLPRGLHWREDSPYIWFTWRDPVGKQHRQSTETRDPQEAALFRLQFMQKAEEHLEQLNSPRSSYSKLPLKEAAELYFNQKAVDHSAGTIARERRLFRRVEKYFGAETPVKKIHLWRIEKYQQERSREMSPTMKQTVTARTINYEMQLLRGVMMYSGCWKGDLAVYYKPLRQKKRATLARPQPTTNWRDSSTLPRKMNPGRLHSIALQQPPVPDAGVVKLKN